MEFTHEELYEFYKQVRYFHGYCSVTCQSLSIAMGRLLRGAPCSVRQSRLKFLFYFIYLFFHLFSKKYDNIVSFPPVVDNDKDKHGLHKCGSRFGTSHFVDL